MTPRAPLGGGSSPSTPRTVFWIGRTRAVGAPTNGPPSKGSISSIQFSPAASRSESAGAASACTWQSSAATSASSSDA
jgi:hypothetical protein